MTEIWKPIPGWEDRYEVSSHGRVRSLKRNIILRPAMSKGYYHVNLGRGSKVRGTYYTENRKIHRMMLIAFTGDPGNKMEAAHVNGDCLDNRLENLYWASRSENMLDRNKHGTMPIGENHKKSKLKVAQVLEIRKRLAAGEKESLLAKEFGVAGQTINAIGIRKTWKWLAESRIDSQEKTK